MSPAACLADLLADARRDGATFKDAWTTAVENVLASEPDERERAAWRVALTGTRSAWLSAWSREPIAGRPLVALVAVAADPDRQQIDPGRRMRPLRRIPRRQ